MDDKAGGCESWQKTKVNKCYKGNEIGESHERQYFEWTRHIKQCLAFVLI